MVNEETKKCPSCDKDISVRAKRCPFCRQKLGNFFQRHPVLTIVGVLITSPFWIAVLIGLYQGFTNPSSNNQDNQHKNLETPAPSSQDTFVASVNFTGTQFVISNLDPHTCEDARMQINGDYELDHYDLESSLESATKSAQIQVYKVDAGQFTKGDGTRFNPLLIKPMNFNIECRGTNELKSAYWYGSFN